VPASGAGRRRVVGRSSALLVECQGEVLRITLNRPDQLNAMSTDMGSELNRILTSITDARAVVLTGNARSFSAGADIKEPPKMLPVRAAAWGVALRQLASYPAPTIAAIEGYCLGGGLELALTCDLRVAGADATFGLPEVRHGVFAAGGGTQRLPRLIGASRAKRMMFLASHIDCGTASRWGLIDEAVEAGSALSTALDWCATIAAFDPEAVRTIKRLVEGSQTMSLSVGLRREQEELRELLQNRDDR
jgi:enoyl-CoA hydratase/carnithine racemase